MFRPARLKVWLPAACGVFFLAIALPFAALPLVVNKSNPALYFVGLVGLFMAGLAAWMFLAARNAACALVAIGDEGLELSLQQWGLWKFGTSRREQFRWAEVQAVKLCQLENFMQPSGLEQNYIVCTPRGEFVLPSTLWAGRAREIAEAIAARIQQPIQMPSSERPVDESLLQPGDRLGLKLMRGFGWLSMILGYVAIALFVLVLGTKGEWDSSLVLGIFVSVIMVIGGKSLRRFKIRMG
jgi:hypothetical protein